MGKESIIQIRSFQFSLKIIELYKILTSRNEFVLSKQVLRSGTSIGANVEEASAGHSRKDFIAKMVIASKEARETRYWLKLLKESKIVDTDYSHYLDEIEQIVKMLTSIVKTAQENVNA